jgi:nitrite reductase (NADH) small subunit
MIDDASTAPTTAEDWVDVVGMDELLKRRKVVHVEGDRQILVLAHEGEVHAFDNICIHRERELHRGVILNGKLVCPGHQWAFALGTGVESVRERCQPTYAVRVVDGVVQVDRSSRAERGAEIAC